MRDLIAAVVIISVGFSVEDERKAQSLREKLQSVQDVCLQVQESMDTVACLGERIKK